MEPVQKPLLVKELPCAMKRSEQNIKGNQQKSTPPGITAPNITVLFLCNMYICGTKLTAVIFRAAKKYENILQLYRRMKDHSSFVINIYSNYMKQKLHQNSVYAFIVSAFRLIVLQNTLVRCKKYTCAFAVAIIKMICTAWASKSRFDLLTAPTN